MDNENMIMDEEFSNIVTLTDEDGEAVKFEFLDLIAYDNEEYVVLLPVDDEEEDGEVVILQVQANGGDDEEYTSVEDEETLQAVFEIFKEKFKDQFNFMC